MTFIKEGKTNWNYILIIVVFVVVAGGFAYWQYSEMQYEEAAFPEVKVREKELKKKEPSEITMNMLKNAKYQLFQCPTSTEPYLIEYPDGSKKLNEYNYLLAKTICRVQLKDGEYDFSDIISEGAGFTVIFSGATFADLNEDGRDEALVTLRVFYGGTGNAAYIAAVKLESGKLRNIDTILIPGDRQSAEIISIDSNIITISSYGHYDLEGYIYKIKLTEESGFEILEKKEFPVVCLAKGTKILMADGTRINIEDVKVGDWVKSFDERTGNLKDAEVIRTIKRKDQLVIVNDILRMAPDEVVYLANGDTKTAAELKVGELLWGENKTKIKIASINYLNEKVDTYDLILKDAENFFAEGFLVRTPE